MVQIVNIVFRVKKEAMGNKVSRVNKVKMVNKVNIVNLVLDPLDLSPL